MDASNVVFTMLGVGTLIVLAIFHVVGNIQAGNAIALATFQKNSSFTFSAPCGGGSLGGSC